MSTVPIGSGIGNWYARYSRLQAHSYKSSTLRSLSPKSTPPCITSERMSCEQLQLACSAPSQSVIAVDSRVSRRLSISHTTQIMVCLYWYYKGQVLTITQLKPRLSVKLRSMSVQSPALQVLNPITVPCVDHPSFGTSAKPTRSLNISPHTCSSTANLTLPRNSAGYACAHRQYAHFICERVRWLGDHCRSTSTRLIAQTF